MSDDPRPVDSVHLDALAERISVELRLLLMISLQLQDAMSCCVSLHNHEAETLGALQGIDRISQALSDLARLTEEIGRRTPDSILLERQPLDARLRLRDLSVRLHLHDAPSLACTLGSTSEPERAPGDVLFF